ncbi:hypothetical protein G3O08_11655 [Cryomorpha ignava]|uniref:Uncharacterized protein n=1 Tax=Cryomorpha ignava TaxID=101383 RepID=A0A7K3WR55_9FLAO|nr:hypothetical protein [Cryomorpha ignava]NEN24157.1 hypothetical protein [Cryomorpha ignava]
MIKKYLNGFKVDSFAWSPNAILAIFEEMIDIQMSTLLETIHQRDSIKIQTSDLEFLVDIVNQEYSWYGTANEITYGVGTTLNSLAATMQNQNVSVSQFITDFNINTIDLPTGFTYEDALEFQSLNADFELNMDLEDFIGEINQEYSLSITYSTSTTYEGIANDLLINNVSEVMLIRDFVLKDITDLDEVFDLLQEVLSQSSIIKDLPTSLKTLLLPFFSTSINNLNLALFFPRTWLKPVDEGTLEVIEDEAVKSKLTYDVGSLLIDTESGFEFKDADNFNLTLSQIGDTGLLINIQGLKLDFRTDRNIPEADADGRPNTFQGVFAAKTSITLPAKWFNNVDNTTLQVAGYNLLIGTGGVSGTIGIETVNGTPSTGDDYLNLKIGNWTVGFNHFAITFKQNVITDSSIAGRLTIPKLKSADTSDGDDTAYVFINGHLNEAGDFNLTGSKPDGFTFHILDFITINILTVELGRQNDTSTSLGTGFYIGTSAEIWFDNPTMQKILGDQKIVVPKLRIYDSGRFEIVGGSSTIPSNITLNLGPVEVSVTGIHFGSHQQNGRKYNYWGFDGAISLDPLGIDARGEGIKYYYTVDNEELAGEGEDPLPYADSFLRIQTIEIDLVIPGSANPDNAKAIIHGMLSIPEPGESAEYVGEVSLKVPDSKLAAGVAMRLQPRYPAFLIEAYLELPKPIPLGPLGVYGFSGLLGYRYVAEKEAVGLAPDTNSWYDYYTYPERGVNLPKFSRPEHTSAYTSPFSFGAGALLATSFDDGWAVSARVMMMLSVPSLFIVEGRAAILSKRIGFDSNSEPPFYAFMAWGGGSIEMGLGADLNIPKSGSHTGDILKMYAQVEARFFLENQAPWYVNFGTQENPVSAEILTLFTAPTYLMIAAKGIKGGARAEFNLDKKYGIAKVKVKAYFEIGGFVSFEKPQIGGYIKAGGVIEVDVWFIGFSIAIDALFSVEVPEPFKIYAQVYVEVCAKVLFVKKCVDFTVELKWEKNDILNQEPIAPLPHVTVGNQIDRTDEAVKGVHMLTNETFPIQKFPVLENSDGTWTPDPAGIDKIIPLDTYIDIKSAKGLLPYEVMSKIGGFTAPPEDYKDLIPPDQVVQGMTIRQIKHEYAISDIELKAWNGTSWVVYHPFEAVVKADTPSELITLRAEVAGLRIGYWQLSGKQYNTIRLLATNPFSYTESGEPGWFIPEQYGITPSTLFCEGTALVPVCCNVLNQTLGKTYYPPTQMNGNLINGAYFTLEVGNIGYVTVNLDGSQNVVEADNNMVVTYKMNPFGFAKSLKFENGNNLVIYLPEISAEVKLKLTTTANFVKIRYYKSGLTENPPQDFILLAEETYTQTELNQEIQYQNEVAGVAKIVIDPDYIDLDAINAVTAQIADLLGSSYGNYSGEVAGLSAQDQLAYDGLIAQLDELLGDGCGSRKRGGESRGGDPGIECFTALHELCWLGVEAFEYNETIPGQDAINQDSLDMQAAIQKVVQPIWRPNTTYYIRFRLRDRVDNGAMQKTYDYYYGFKTVGPLGHYHLNAEVDCPLDHPLASFRRYIDYRRSYPNADGDLLMSKPVFYANRQCKINLFFTKPLTYNMVNKWHEYHDLPDLEGALHIAIKDPVSEVTIPYPLPIEVDESIPVPADDSGWINDDDPLIPLNIAALNNQILQGNTDPDVQCTLAIGDPLVPYSQSYQVILTNLKPQKLYTALFYNAFDNDATNSLEASESEQVHQYPFQTSRYGNFREQVESYMLKELNNQGNIVNERNAVFKMTIPLSVAAVDSAFSLFPFQTADAGAKALSLKYQDPFDRVVEGLFGIVPINPPETTEFNVIVNTVSNKTVAILIKNPEPFNNPKMPVDYVLNTITVRNAADEIDVNYIGLYSKDYAQVLLMHTSKVISAASLNFMFQYKAWNGNGYAVDIIGNDAVNQDGELLNQVKVVDLVIN